MRIWVDADGCPVPIKEIIFRAAERLRIQTTLVAHSPLKLPKNCQFVSMICVAKGFDAADTYIVEHLNSFDLVVTADVPLAALIVEKGAIAIHPKGDVYTVETIQERLAMRNFFQTLREGRLIQGGSGPFHLTDRQNFASSFERQVGFLLKKERSSIFSVETSRTKGISDL